MSTFWTLNHLLECAMMMWKNLLCYLMKEHRTLCFHFYGNAQLWVCCQVCPNWFPLPHSMKMNSWKLFLHNPLILLRLSQKMILFFYICPLCTGIEILKNLKVITLITIYKTVFDQIQYDANGLINSHPNEHKFAMYSNYLIWIVL